MEHEKPTDRDNVFERHPVLTRTALIVFVLLAVELVSYVVLLAFSSSEERYPYNRVISGYYVFKNTPNFGFDTVTNGQDLPPARLDARGLLCDSPVSMSKPDDVIRIFVMGGSAAFGAGQHPTYGDVIEYPVGLFAYDLSLAGQLKKALKALHPGRKYEVITAASYNRVFHQSFMQYVETIARYSPDVVINLDGFNDVFAFSVGDPFELLEGALPKYIDLYVGHHDPPFLKRLNTYRVIESMMNRFGVWEQQQPPDMHFEYGDYTEAMYAEQRQALVDNSERFLQILEHYAAVLRSDGVKFTFVLQPMLHRRLNKKLSPSETAMRDRHHPRPRSHSGRKSSDREALVFKYFFDEYLSGELATRAERSGFGFVDGNEAITDLGPDFEFFTDYCHMTANANAHLAEVLARKLEPR